MMSENYNDFVRAYQPDSIFYHTISMIVHCSVKEDKSRVGFAYAIRKNDSTYRMWLQMGANHKIVNDEMRCTHNDSKGTNWDIMSNACQYIANEMLHIPTDNKEIFIKQILRRFSGTYYNLLEPIFKDKKRYATIYSILTDDNDHKEKQSYEFVDFAYQTYQSFVLFLYGICEKHNIDLDSLQDDNNLRITPYRSKPKSTPVPKNKKTTLSSDERAKKIERVRQYLESKVFPTGLKRTYPELVEDVTICAVDECKTGKDIMALAILLYDSKITIIGKPHTMKDWVNQFKLIVECDKPTDYYKDRKDVEEKIKKHLKRFTYLPK